MIKLAVIFKDISLRDILFIYLFIVALIAILGFALSGCYVERGYHHPYHHYYYYHYYHHY